MIGIDILEIARVEKALENEKFVSRVFSKLEQEYIFSKNNAKSATAAGIFCAKEAVIKVCGGVLSDYEIIRDSSGKPEVNGRDDLEISISHCKDYATSVCIKTFKTGEN